MSLKERMDKLEHSAGLKAGQAGILVPDPPITEEEAQAVLKALVEAGYASLPARPT